MQLAKPRACAASQAGAVYVEGDQRAATAITVTFSGVTITNCSVEGPAAVRTWHARQRSGQIPFGGARVRRACGVWQRRALACRSEGIVVE